MDARKKIIAAFKNVLEPDDRIVFAYLYGSFARGEAFRENSSDFDAFIHAIQLYVSTMAI